MGSFLFLLSGKERNYMKKEVIIKRKSITKFPNRKKLIGSKRQAAIVGLAALLLAGTMNVQAKESTQKDMTGQVYVYHAHKGNETEGGGCYSVPVYHVHDGSEEKGGKCYETPVYHVHEGDEQNGGPCYGKAVYHQHEGNENEGGVCFKAVYHSHTESCYKLIPNETVGCTVLRVEETDYDDYADHDFKDYYMSCGVKVHGTNPGHNHRELTCNREGKIDSFKVICKMNSSTIERYELDCVKTEETIDFYRLTCPKTEADIDKFERGCGREEETPLGKITVTGKLASSKKKGTLSAVYEDMSEGELTVSEKAFSWYNEKGKLLGEGNQIQVTQNGKYYVILNVLNEDVQNESLKAEVQMRGIQKKKPEEKEEQKEEDSDEGEDEQGSEDGGGGTGGSTPVPESPKTPTPAPADTPQPTAAPKATAVPIEEMLTPSPDMKNKSFEDTKDSNLQKKYPTITPSPLPVIQKEKIEVELEKKQSRKEEPVTVEEVKKPTEQKKSHLLSAPAVKMITVTAGTLVCLAGAGLLLLLFGRSIRVYNDDGKGNQVYLGRGMVKTQEEGYVLLITEKMTEKSLTNRYCLRCDFFHLWKDKEEELIVVKGERRQIVKIQKEMITVL